MTIATGFALLGAWLILPFAGLEMLALAACLYCCARRAARWEQISIDERTVEVQSGHRAPERTCSFQRAWARVNLERPASAWHPSRLTIRSHGREVQIGSCLCEDERERLARELRGLLGSYAAPRMPAM